MANQVLGRGKFYFDPFTDETTKVLTGARALGNVPEASMAVETVKSVSGSFSCRISRN